MDEQQIIVGPHSSKLPPREDICKHNQGITPPHDYQPTRKSICFKLLCGFKILDDLIDHFYSGSMRSFDMIIRDADISPLFKKILHGKQIVYLSFIVTNYIFLYNWTWTLFLVSFWSLACLVLYLNVKSFFISSMYVVRYEELEKFILEKNPDIRTNFCESCKIIRCLRSQHCQICNRCVLKFEMHSDWFNMCIGSQNCLDYLIVIFFTNVYLFTSLINLGYTVIFTNEFQGMEFQYHLWFCLLLFLTLKMFLFSTGFFSTVMSNLTQYEKYNWRRLAYLWRNRRKDFYNPFDKGAVINLKELWCSFKNDELSVIDHVNIKLSGNENLNPCDRTIGIQVDDEAQAATDTKIIPNLVAKNPTHQHFLNLSKPFEPLITQDNKVVYKRLSGQKEEIVNWNRIRVYTIFDIGNSPFREVLLKQAEAY